MNRIAQRFGRAAATYDQAAMIQRQAALALAQAMAEASPAPRPAVAEFGCGTGRLARAAWPLLQPRLWAATDLAAPMAGAARAVLPGEAVVAVMDAARPALAPGFDLACSSLALQWIADPAAAVSRWRSLVRPGGLLAVATLVDGTFAEWRSALASAGAAATGPAFADTDRARAWFAPGAEVRRLSLREAHPNGLAFLRAARAAGIDAADGRALPAGTMRRALRALEARGASLSYEVLIVVERVV